MSEMMNQCPGCGRHCDLSAPGCPRGEALARGETPEMRNGERPRGNEHGERRIHGEHEARGCRGEHGREHGEHGRRGEHGKRRPMEQEEYEALDLDGKLGVKLRELALRGRFVMDSRGGQEKILRVLAQEGELTQRALTERLGIQPGSASEVIGKLERAGLIERSENAEDRRTADIRLTEQGRDHAQRTHKEKPELFSALSGQEKEQLLSLLEKLSADWQSRFSEEGHRHPRRGDE